MHAEGDPVLLHSVFANLPTASQPSPESASRTYHSSMHQETPVLGAAVRPYRNSRQHRQCLIGERLVDERLLVIRCLNGTPRMTTLFRDQIRSRNVLIE